MEYVTVTAGRPGRRQQYGARRAVHMVEAMPHELWYSFKYSSKHRLVYRIPTQRVIVPDQGRLLGTHVRTSERRQRALPEI